MKTSPVTFCNSSVEQVIDHSTKTTIIDGIRQCININIADWTHRLIRNKKDATYLQNPHLMSIASYGNRWMMYLTQINHMNVCILIERSIKPGYPYPKMLLVHFQFNEILYQNTLFDLEILDNAKGHDTPLILVCDILMMKNRDVTNWDPVRRTNTIHTIFDNQFTNNIHLQPSAIQVKRLFCMKNFNEMIELVKALPYTTKGIHFLPLNSKYPTRTWIDTHKELVNGVMLNEKESENIQTQETQETHVNQNTMCNSLGSY